MNTCDFCGKETVGKISGGWSDIDEGKNLPSVENGYTYSCCEKCWETMKPFVLVPRDRVLIEGIFSLNKLQ